MGLGFDELAVFALGALAFVCCCKPCPGGPDADAPTVLLCVFAAGLAFEAAARFPLFDRRLLSICVNDVAVGPGMLVEFGGKEVPIGELAAAVWPPGAAPFLLRALVTVMGPLGLWTPPGTAVASGESTPVGEAAVLRGREPLDKKDVRSDGRKCEVVSDSIII